MELPGYIIGVVTQVLCCTAIYRSTVVFSLKEHLWLVLLPHVLLKPGWNFYWRHPYESNHTMYWPYNRHLYLNASFGLFSQNMHLNNPFSPLSYNWSFIFIVSISVNNMNFPDWWGYLTRSLVNTKYAC